MLRVKGSGRDDLAETDFVGGFGSDFQMAAGDGVSGD